MSEMGDLIVKRVMDSLSSTLRASLQNLDTKKVNDKTKEQIKNTMLQVLSGFNKVHCIKEDYGVTNVQILWTLWNWRQKLVWHWKHTLKFGIKELELYEEALREVYDNAEYKGDFDICSEWSLEHPWKYWYERNPKTITVLDIYFKPVLSAKTIRLDLTKVQ